MFTYNNKQEVLEAINNASSADSLILKGISAADAEAIISARNRLPGRKFLSLEQALNLVHTDSLLHWYKGLLSECGEDRPVLLLPLRLETVVVNGEIRIRFYPDDVLLDKHDPRLTKNEISASQAYKNLIATAGGNSDVVKDAWRTLSSRFGPSRASWIATVVTQSGSTQDIKDDEEAWSSEIKVGPLPDRFAVYLYNSDGKLAHPAIYSNYVIPDLQMLGGGDESKLFGDKSKWVGDYNSALASGMAVSINLSQLDLGNQPKLSRIVVVGLKRQKPEENQKALEDLFNSHHYTDGLAFLRQGTATNNTSDEKSGYSSVEDHEATHQFEVTDPPGWDTTDSSGSRHNAQRLGVALGFGQRPEVFRHVYGAGDRTEDTAAAMNAALWPVLGYSFMKMLPINISPQHMEAAHDHFALYVRAGGPLPTLRIGRQPYGVLPVMQLNAEVDGAVGWAASQTDTPSNVAFDTGLHHVLRKLYDLWLKYAGDPTRVPRIRGLTDPEKELLEILSMQPVSVDVAARPMVDRGFTLLSLAILQERIFGLNTQFTKNNPILNPKDWLTFWRDSWQLEITEQVACLLHAITDLTITRFDQSKIAKLFAWSTTIDPGPLSIAEDERPDDYLKALCAKENKKTANTLLHELLQRSLTIDSLNSGSRVYDAICRLASETVLHFLNNVKDAETIVKTICDDPSQSSGSPQAYGVRLSLALKIIETRNSLPNQKFTSFKEIDAIQGVGEDTFQDIIYALKGYSVSADIDYLFRQTLDLFSHRLDAWFTSLATKRLVSMRARIESGIHIGAYGYLEDLDIPETSKTSLGYIHTPSADQTAAATVLYSAFRSREAVSAAGHPFYLNLTTDRVNRSLQLFQGVREGQTLGALLGYQFERRLHIRKDSTKYLDQYIDDFRKAFPIVANNLMDIADGQSVEAVAARNVVDGVALAQAWRARSDGATDASVTRLEKVFTTIKNIADLDSVKKELSRLLDSLDAVGDLLMYESVYHSVAGNVQAAGAALDAASGKGHLPEISSMKTRVNANVLDHRVVMFLPVSDEPQDVSPRSMAEPSLANWFFELIPSLGRIGCSFSWVDKDGKEHVPMNPYVSVKDLGITAIDFLYLSALPLKGEETELEQRVRRVARTRNKIPYDLTIKLDLTKPDDFEVGFDEATEFARISFALVSQSSAIDPAALALPAEAESTHYEIADAKRINDRVIKARERLKELCTQLSDLLKKQTSEKVEPETRVAIDQLLLGISCFGVPGAVALGPDDPGLLSRARSVVKEVEKKITVVDGITEFDQSLQGAQLDLIVDSYVKALQQMFGKSFTVLPPFSPAGISSLQASIKDKELLGQTGDHRVRLWLQQEAEVHPEIERLEDWLLVAEAWCPTSSGIKRMELNVAQLPHLPGRRWLGLNDEERNKQERDREALSFVMAGKDLTELIGDNGPSQVAGVMIHRCQDRVPVAKVDTSIGFHYDAPSSQAPQALILAVPSKVTNPPGVWSEDELEAIVGSAMDLAKIRAVDLDALSAPDPDAQFNACYWPKGVGALIPALFIPVDHSRPDPEKNAIFNAMQDWIGPRRP